MREDAIDAGERRGGEHQRIRAFGASTITISRTPATFAGTAFISTDDGYAALPPGT